MIMPISHPPAGSKNPHPSGCFPTLGEVAPRVIQGSHSYFQVKNAPGLSFYRARADASNNV